MKNTLLFFMATGKICSGAWLALYIAQRSKPPLIGQKRNRFGITLIGLAADKNLGLARFWNGELINAAVKALKPMSSNSAFSHVIRSCFNFQNLFPTALAAFGPRRKNQKEIL